MANDNSWQWVSTRNEALAFWIYIVYCILIVTISLFYLFYLNRIITYFLSKLISYYAWRKFKLHVNVGAISLALLTGKVMFKNISIYTADQCFIASRGYVSFRYWFRKVRSEKLVGEKASQLPCRIRIRIDGFEWFLYNLTGTYDWLEKVLQGSNSSSSSDSNNESEQSPQRKSETLEASAGEKKEAPSHKRHERGKNMTSASETNSLFKFWSILTKDTFESKNLNKMPADDYSKDAKFRELMPISFVGVKGSITIGNPHLRQMLVAQYQEVEGTFECCRPRSSYDWYRTVLNADFKELKAAMRTNSDYRDPFLTKPEELYTPRFTRFRIWAWRFFGFHTLKKLLWRRKKEALGSSSGLNSSFANFSNSNLSESSSNMGEKPVWHGLQRYQELERMRLQNNRKFHEQYAKVSEFLDVKRCSVRYFTDKPGYVPFTHRKDAQERHDLEVGNGDLSPEWGCDIDVYTATINYGPWLERQRHEIQKFYFPQTFRDLEKTPLRQGGEQRVFTQFALSVRFHEKTTLRIPSRESSKDWMYADDMLELKSPASPQSPAKKGRSAVPSRAYGWVDVICESKSSLVLSMPVVQSSNGSTMQFELSLCAASVITSVNYAPMISAAQIQLCSQFHYPLQWNGPQTQQHSVTLTDPTVWLLNEHITLITDMVGDFAAGPQVSAQYFVPCVYEIPVSATNLNLKICLNDNNIIDHHNGTRENVYLTLGMQTLSMKYLMDLSLFSPRYRTATAQIVARDIVGRFSFPESSTLGKFQSAEQNVLALEKLAVSLDYTYGLAVAPDLRDSCSLKFKLRNGRVLLYGYVVRYLLLFSDNYFNLHGNAISRDEYLTRENNLAAYKTLKKRQEAYLPPSNPFELNVDLRVLGIIAYLPEPLYGSNSEYLKSGMLGLYCPTLKLENRGTTLYQFFKVSSSPITLHKFFPEESSSEAEGTNILDGGSSDFPNGLSESPTSFKEVEIESKESHDTDFDLLESLGNMCKSAEGLRFKDGLYITGHRCMGPLPEKAVYAVNYKMKLGSIVGEPELEWFERIGRFGTSFMYHYNDWDNVLVPPVEVPDLTVVELVVDAVSIAIWFPEASIGRLDMSKGLQLTFDNYMSEEFTKRLAVESESVLFEVIVPAVSSASGNNPRANSTSSFPGNFLSPTGSYSGKGGSVSSSWTLIFSVSTKLSVLLFLRASNWEEWAEKQREFVLSNDKETARVSQLFASDHVSGKQQTLFQQYLPFSPSYFVCHSKESRNPSAQQSASFEPGVKIASKWSEALRRARRSKEASDLPNTTTQAPSVRKQKGAPLFVASNAVNASNESLASLLMNTETLENVDFELADGDVPAASENSGFVYKSKSSDPSDASYSLSCNDSCYQHYISFGSLLPRYRIWRNGTLQGDPLSFEQVNQTGIFASRTSLESRLSRNSGSSQSLVVAGSQERIKFSSKYFRGCLAAKTQFFRKLPRHQTAGTPVKSIVVELFDSTHLLVTPTVFKWFELVCASFCVEEAADWCPESLLDNLQKALTETLVSRFERSWFAEDTFVLFKGDAISANVLQNVEFLQEHASSSYVAAKPSISRVDLALGNLELQISNTPEYDKANLSKDSVHLPSTSNVLEQSTISSRYAASLVLKKFILSVKLVEHPDWSLGFSGLPRVKQSSSKLFEAFLPDSSGAREYPTVLDVCFTGFSAASSLLDKGNTNSCMSLQSGSLQCVNQSLEILFGTAKRWFSAWGDSSLVFSKYAALRAQCPQLYLAYLAELLVEEDLVSQVPLVEPSLQGIWSVRGRYFAENYSWLILSHARRCQSFLSQRSNFENDWRLCWTNYFNGDMGFPATTSLLKKIFELWDDRLFQLARPPELLNIDLITLLFPKSSLNDPSLPYFVQSASSSDDGSSHCFAISSNHLQFSIYSGDAEENFIACVAPKLKGKLSPNESFGSGDTDSTVASTSKLNTPNTSPSRVLPLGRDRKASISFISEGPPQVDVPLKSGKLLSVVANVKELIWTFNPMQLVFFLHAKRVYNLIQKQKPPRLTAPSEESSVFKKLQMTLQASLKGDKLVFRAGSKESAIVCVINDAFASNLHFPRADSQGAIVKEQLKHLVCAGISSITLQAAESSTDLVTVKVDNVLGNATVSQQAMGQPDQSSMVTGQSLLQRLTLFASVSGVHVHVLRTFLKLHAFFEKWTDAALNEYEAIFTKFADQWVTSGSPGSAGANFNSKLAHEIKEQPVSFVVESLGRPLFDFIHLQFLVRKFTVESDVLENLRFGYHAHDLLIFVDQSTEIDRTRRKPGADALSSSKFMTAAQLPESFELKTNFFFQLAKQEVTFATKQLSKSFNSHRAVFVIPRLSLEGCVFHPIHTIWVSGKDERDKIRVETKCSIDFVELKLNVNVIDQVLTAYSVIFSEISDFLEIMTYYKQNNAESSALESESNQDSEKKANVLYSIKLSFAGFRVEVESPKAVAYCNSKLISGFMINHPHPALLKILGAVPAIWQNSSKSADSVLNTMLWRLSADNFAFSIHSRLGPLPQSPLEQAGYVLVTFESQNFVAHTVNRPRHMHTKSVHTMSTFSTAERNPSIEPSVYDTFDKSKRRASEFLFSKPDARDTGNLWVTVVDKCFAVMQPLAVQCIGDIFVFYSTELDRRRELKYKELEAIELRAKALIRSLDERFTRYRAAGIDTRDFPAVYSSAAFDSRSIEFAVNRLGVALPLQHDGAGTTSGSGSSPSPAFFISSDSLYFGSKTGQESTFTMKELGFQFVPSFDPTIDASFCQSTHGTSNRLYFPKITTKVKTSFEINPGASDDVSISLSRLVISGESTGFELDLDESVALYINLMLEIYQVNKMERLFQAFAVSNLPAEEPVHAKSVDIDTSASTEDQFKRELQNFEVTTLDSAIIDDDVSVSSRLTNIDASSILSGLDSDKSKRKASTTSILDICGALDFGSSVCRLHSAVSSEEMAGLSPHQLIALPGAKLQTVGALLLGDHSAGLRQIQEAARPIYDLQRTGLHFQIDMEPVENIIYPIALSFAKRIITQVELDSEAVKAKSKTMQTAATLTAPPSPTEALPKGATTFNVPAAVDASSTRDGEQSDSTATNGSIAVPRENETGLELMFSLKLKCSGSKLVLCCEPKAKVNAVVVFSDFDLFLSMVPAPPQGKVVVRKMFFGAAQAKGVSLFLQHQYSPESCVRAEFDKIVFNGTLSGGSSTVELFIPSVTSHWNTRYLQDYYLFDQLWVKQFPQLLSGLQGLSSASALSFNDTASAPLSVRVAPADLPLQMRILVSVGTTNATIDLGHSIGKSFLSIDSIDSIAAYQEKQFTMTLFWDSCVLKSEGKFSGSCLFSQLMFEFITAAPFYKSKANSSSTKAWAQLESLSCNVQYQFERIALLELKMASFSLGDLLQRPNASAMRKVLSLAEIESLKGVISRKTVPTLVHMADRIVHVFLDKKEAANATGASEPSGKMPTLIAGASAHSALEDKLFGAYSQMVGSIGFKVHSALLHIMKYNFRDPEYAQVMLKSLFVAMVEQQSRDSASEKEQLTSVDIKSIGIRKCTCKPISQNDERVWDMNKWFAFLGSASGKNVIGIPYSELNLYTRTNELTRRVKFHFDSSFKGAVDVALNFGLYRFLQELAVLYERALSKESETGTGSGAVLSPIASATTSPTNVEAPAGAAPTGDAENAHGGTAPESETWHYDQDGAVKFEPQLKVIGDATPKEWLDLLGLHKHNVPQLTHRLLTTNLGAILAALEELYGRVAILGDPQLAQQLESDLLVETMLLPTATSQKATRSHELVKGTGMPLDCESAFIDQAEAEPTDVSLTLTQDAASDSSSMVSANS